MKKIILGTIIIGFIIACSSSSSGGSGGTTDNYDRSALLVNLADNIIIPAFQDLETELSALTEAKNNFVATPNQANLEALRASWLTAYTAWQYVEMFNIGEAETVLYGFQMNIYPTNIDDISANINSGSYDLTHTNNNDAVGFPAVDYMIYGLADNDTDILTFYQSENYTSYLSDLIDQMESLTSSVLTNWNSSYRNTFVSQTGNTATSSLNKFTNDFIYYFEKGLRLNKFGTPAGVFSTDPLPETVEALYAKAFSKDLALEALSAVEAVFYGDAFSGSGSGESFESYLISLDRADLVTEIATKFEDAREKIEALDDSFYDQINTDNTKMTEAYDALQLLVVSFKVDMLQAFNISVDYRDNDGD
ncbi:imelysin family protein [Neotamlana laminarinivorans]|uniref:Imelysin family protein n=1 Tax=Neotamlana laminarinivorans TaxID=2883124 RepID=A0A9X1L2K5_9FLAO|nr:imelysin family protein [Tamlana laminarinivorans]MCB4799950.1 imelysin family protein [Tamlana laminarinivorans]